MEPKNQCPRCSKSFSSQQRLRSHFESQTNCHSKASQLICSVCQKSFSRKFCLDKHFKKHKVNLLDQTVQPLFPIKLKLKTNHDDNKLIDEMANKLGLSLKEEIPSQKIVELIEKQNDERDHRIAQLIERQISQQNQKIAEQNQKIAELIQKPSNVINNNLQIICVGSNDNYLDMLSQQWGFDRAIDYIKDCALSSLTGDCKLIEKIYIENHPNSINYIDWGIPP